LDVHGRQRVHPGRVRRDPDQAVRDRVELSQPIAERRPTERDLLDLALDVHAGAIDRDPVALEEGALDQDHDPHEVVEDDRLPRERDGRRHEAQAGEGTEEVEHAEHQHDDPDEEAGPDQLVEHVLQGRSPLLELLGRLARGERGLLNLDQARDDSRDQGRRDAVDREQDQAANDQGKTVPDDPARELAQGHGVRVARTSRRGSTPHLTSSSRSVTLVHTIHRPRFGRHVMGTSAEPVRLALRKLWSDHVIWTREYIVAAVAGTPDADAAAGRLLKNQEDIGAAIVPYYGEDAGDALTGLLKQHILIAVDLVAAAKSGDNGAFATHDARWTA